MLSTQARYLSRARRANTEVEASARVSRGEVKLVSWQRELPSGLERQLVAWARSFPARFDEIVCMPNYDLSAATHGLAVIVPYECLSVCRRPCGIALRAPRTLTYVFGDLKPGEAESAVIE